MAIFGKKPGSSEGPSSDRPSPAPGSRSRSGAPAPSSSTKAGSFLGPGCELDGELRGKGSFECRGRFNGTVEIEGDVIVGREGRAEARLSARRIVIEGHLEGDAIGTEKVEVGATGHVEGDVRAPAVMFQEGAFFEGNVEMHRSSDADAAGDDEDGPEDGSSGSGSGEEAGAGRTPAGNEGKSTGN